MCMTCIVKFDPRAADIDHDSLQLVSISSGLGRMSRQDRKRPQLWPMF